MIKTSGLLLVLVPAMEEYLGHEGFIFDSRQRKFKKKSDGSDIHIGIDIYKFPEALEFRLMIYFELKEVKKSIEKLYSYCGKEYGHKWAIIFFEGDFHPRVRHLESKFRIS